MSTETTMAITLAVAADIDDFLCDLEAAFRRASKSEPGERTDIVAFEALSAALELRAVEALRSGVGNLVAAPSPETLTAGVFQRSGSDVIVMLTLPLSPGTRALISGVAPAPAPAATVEIRDDLRGRRLVLERFREQLQNAIAGINNDRGTALNPSGIHNRVLTEILREYVKCGNSEPVAVPVVYRDGSRATNDFPFRCVALGDHITPDDVATANGTLILRLALLSIRHTEMDAVVDGAWLRNADVSKPRPAAQTDDYVYHQSINQLAELTHHGQRTVRLYMFQTGLETAVMGFFRAVAEILNIYPGRLEVIPMFFAKNARQAEDEVAAGYEPGEPWTSQPGTR